MIALDQRLRGSRVAVIDFETTGTSKTSRIVEVGVVLVDRLWETEPLVVLSQLVDPGMPIPWQASHVHGIYDRHVRGRPRWAAVWPLVAEAIDGAILCAYNSSFDARILRQEAERCGLPLPAAASAEWLDPYPLVRRMDPKRWTLEAACQRRGIRRGGHRAASDARATMDLLLRIIREAYARPELQPAPPQRPTVGQWLAWQAGRSVPDAAPAELIPSQSRERSPSPVPRPSRERSQAAWREIRGAPRAVQGKPVCVPCSHLHPKPRHVAWAPEVWSSPTYETPCTYCGASSTGHVWGPARHLPASSHIDLFGRPPKKKTGRLADLAAEAPPAPADLEEVDA